MSKILGIHNLLEKAQEYLKIKFELLKMDLIEKGSGIIVQVIALLVTLMVSFLVIGFASVTLALYLNHILDNTYLGFLMVTILYFLGLVIFMRLIKSGRLHEKIEDALLASQEEQEIEEEDD